MQNNPYVKLSYYCEIKLKNVKRIIPLPADKMFQILIRHTN